MRHRFALLAGAAILAATAACSDVTGTRLTSLSTASLSAALVSVPAGYGDLASSYVGASAEQAGDSSMWAGGGRHRGGPGHGDLMGGGLADPFTGAIGFDGHRDGHHGPFGGGLGCSGTFSAATGRVTCDTLTLRNGLTVVRVGVGGRADANGSTQQAFDSLTTDRVDLQSEVNGTLTFVPRDSGSGDADGDALTDSASAERRGGRGDHHGRGWGDGRGPLGQLLGDTARILSATTVVHSTSERTVSGLAQGSAQRAVSGASSGTETTTGTTSRGDFTATRTAADTTTGLIVPVVTTGPAYPTAGTVVRSMTATLTYAGAAPVSIARREVVTYDGSATAQVTITEDGVTKSCTRALPRGALVCQ